MLNDAKRICLNAIKRCLPQEAVKDILNKHSIEGSVYLVAVGKAAFSMAEAACKEINITKGIVISKYSHIKGDLNNIECYEAGHPLLDANTFSATRKVLSMIDNLKENDTVLFLLSGGASSLFELSELSIDELQNINDQMLKKGLNINEINTIRKKLSKVKGGKFADLCKPARVFSIILSDVLNDQLDVIGSGPTAKDSTDSNDAFAIIEKYGLELSEKATELIKNSRSGVADNSENYVVGSVRLLCQYALSDAEQLGYKAILLTDNLDVECDKARQYIKENIEKYINDKEDIALIIGGEITVNVKGNGLGGRNQQLVLSLAKDIKDYKNVLVMSLGSDGTDGPTDAAGGYVDGKSYSTLLSMNIDYDKVLNNNDAYHALESIDGLIKTGPTGTNVNDITVVLIKNKQVKMYPDRLEAERLLKEAEKCNPGPWGNHSRTVAHCAERIASCCGLNPDKAYVLGLLHDIGRKFGVRHLGHVSDGYSYMMSLGYDDVAKICLTHSFNHKDISAYVGNHDTSKEETELIIDRLNHTEFDDYDYLIQLCDAISGSDGVMDIIDRMNDVKRRYGDYNQDKWNLNIQLKDYFEKKMGKDIYSVVEKETFKPNS